MFIGPRREYSAALRQERNVSLLTKWLMAMLSINSSIGMPCTTPVATALGTDFIWLAVKNIWD